MVSLKKVFLDSMNKMMRCATIFSFNQTRKSILQGIRPCDRCPKRRDSQTTNANQRFHRADSRIVLSGSPMAIAALGAPCPPSEKALSSGTELQTYLVSCVVSLVKLSTKGIIQTINFVDQKLSSLSDSLRFSRISVDGP